MNPDEFPAITKAMLPYRRQWVLRQAKLHKVASYLTTYQMGVLTDIHTNVPVQVTKNALMYLAEQGLIRIGRKVTITLLGREVLEIIGN